MPAFHNHPQMVDHNYIQHNTVVTPPHAIFRNTEYRKRSLSKGQENCLILDEILKSEIRTYWEGCASNSIPSEIRATQGRGWLWNTNLSES